MLRSLVGSEMCIRDSFKQVYRTAYYLPDNSTTWEAVSYEEAKYLQSQICLLYTSDAADDLLCVDLGGRRIINKNTQHQYIRIYSQ